MMFQKKKKRAMILAAIIMAVMLVLAGCSSSTSGGEESPAENPGGNSGTDNGEAVQSTDKTSFSGKLVVLTPWGGGMREQFENMFADFNKEYPNVEVELLDETTAEFAALIAAGNTPDIISVVGNSPQYRADGLLEEITEYIEADPQVSADMFFEPAFNKLISTDGRVWGLPWHVDPNFGFMYHPDILDQYGVTEMPEINSLEEFGDFLRKFWVVEAGEQVMTTFLPHEIYGPLNTLQTIAYANGARTTTFYDATTNTANFNDPLIVEALEWIVQFKREHVNDERLANLNDTLPEGQGPFQAKKRLLEPHVTPNLRSNYEANPEIAFAKMPAQSLWLGGWDFAMTSGGQNKEAAWELLKWMAATNEGAQSVQEHFGWISGKKDNPYFAELAQTDPISEMSLDILNNVQNSHLGALLPVHYEEEFNEKWNQVVYEGTLEPRAFLDHMNTYIQELLDEWALTQ